MRTVFLSVLALLFATTAFAQESFQPGDFSKILNNFAVNSGAKYAAEHACKSVNSSLSGFEPEEGNPSAYIATCANGTKVRITSADMRRQ